MAEEIKSYCTDDVQILKDGCMKFRYEFMNSTKLDPFQNAFTIAGHACGCLDIHIFNQTSLAVFH